MIPALSVKQDSLHYDGLALVRHCQSTFRENRLVQIVTARVRFESVRIIRGECHGCRRIGLAYCISSGRDRRLASFRCRRIDIEKIISASCLRLLIHERHVRQPCVVSMLTIVPEEIPIISRSKHSGFKRIAASGLNKVNLFADNMSAAVSVININNRTSSLRHVIRIHNK